MEDGTRRTRFAWPVALAGIVAFSFSAPLYQLSASPPALGSALRFAYATPLLALIQWRRGGLRPGPELRPAALAGLIVGVELVIWNEATRRIGAGPSTVVVNTASLWVIALSVLVLRAPLARRAVAGAVVVIAGLVLLRGTGAHRLDLVGIALAVLAAALYGAYILLFDVAVSRARSRTAPVLQTTAIAAFVSLACALALREPFHLTAGQHAWLALLGVGVQALGWMLVAESLRWFTAVTVSILLLLQPALSAVWGATFLGETLTAIQVGGIAVVLVGVAAVRPRATR